MTVKVQQSLINAVLVFQNEKAVIANISIRCVKKQTKRIVFHGPISLAKDSTDHLTHTVIPMVDSVLGSLAIKSASYAVTISNLSAASVLEQEINISGNSMELPLFLGLLSASLRLSVSNTDVFTGQINGSDGRILMVHRLPEKLQCAIHNTKIKRIFIPSLDSEDSLKVLRPKLRESLHCTIAQAKESIRVEQCCHIDQLIPSVFDEKAVLYGALATNRFAETASGGVITQYFSADLPRRFFNELRRCWMAMDNSEHRLLLKAWCGSHERIGVYPPNCGRSLSALILTLPPQIKRYLRTDFPLSKTSRLKLAQLANEGDAPDVEKLFSLEKQLDIGDESAPRKNVSNTILEKLLTKLSERELAKEITVPILEARAQFHLSSTIVKNSAEFFDTVRAFYIHVQQQTGDVILDAQNPFLQSASVELIKRSYPEENGLRHALREATDPTQGGISLVLDKMSQTLCSEQQSSFISHALSTAIDSLDWEGELKLAEAFLTRLKPELPDDLENLCAEELVSDWQNLMMCYIQTRNQFHKTLRNA